MFYTVFGATIVELVSSTPFLSGLFSGLIVGLLLGVVLTDGPLRVPSVHRDRRNGFTSPNSAESWWKGDLVAVFSGFVVGGGLTLAVTGLPVVILHLAFDLPVEAAIGVFTVLNILAVVCFSYILYRDVQ